MTNERISRNALASGSIGMESTDAGLAPAELQALRPACLGGSSDFLATESVSLVLRRSAQVRGWQICPLPYGRGSYASVPSVRHVHVVFPDRDFSYVVS